MHAIPLFVGGMGLLFVGVMLFSFRKVVSAILRRTSMDRTAAFPRAGSTRSVAAFGGFIAALGVIMLAVYVVS